MDLHLAGQAVPLLRRGPGSVCEGARRQWHIPTTKGVACHAANSSSPQDSPPWHWAPARWRGYRPWRRLPRALQKQPSTLEGIFELNDVELFDLQADPDEMQNLATEPKKHGDLLLAMNAKMNQLIDAEVGVDDGSFLPGENANWAATKFDP